jgi:hypothetical protein
MYQDLFGYIFNYVYRNYLGIFFKSAIRPSRMCHILSLVLREVIGEERAAVCPVPGCVIQETT